MSNLTAMSKNIHGLSTVNGVHGDIVMKFIKMSMFVKVVLIIVKNKVYQRMLKMLLLLIH